MIRFSKDLGARHVAIIQLLVENDLGVLNAGSGNGCINSSDAAPVAPISNTSCDHGAACSIWERAAAAVASFDLFIV